MDCRRHSRSRCAGSYFDAVCRSEKAEAHKNAIDAAKAAGATLVLVGRPPEQKGYSYDEVLEMMRIRFHLAAASVLEVQPTQAKRKVTLVASVLAHRKE